MIISLVRMGGLGNQLFQYAAALAVYILNDNSIIYLEPETINIHNHRHYNYAKLFMNHGIEITNSIDLPLFDQGGFGDEWNPSSIQLPIRLQGYFQYLPAIQHVIPIIKSRMLTVLQSRREYIKNKLDLDENTAIFMHVRRGDYLTLSNFHYVQNHSYFEQSWSVMYPRSHNTMVYIISDDIEWCKNEIWSFPCHFFDNNDELDALALMSLCKGGAIIANSSFSWWGAMLSDTKRVTYPAQWINASIPNIFPSHWIKVG